MSSTQEEDPFLQVQADVLSALPPVRQLFTSYLRIRSLPSSSSKRPSPELLSATSDLKTALSSLAEDLADLVESVKAVQSDPYKYGLEIEEVTRRKRVVDEVGGEVEDMREELAKTSSSSSYSNGNSDGGGAGRENDGRFGDEREPDYNAEFEQEQQLQMIAEQDRDLDSVFHTVGNLRQQADHMGRELEEQREMLEVVDGLADRVGGRLQTGIKRLGEVARKNEDGLSSCCIGLLIFVLILLLVLVLIL
ncbi:related to syntaxin family member TLG1 [Rhynchosporium graminicola]|uniref:t-SNARE affecting a late Golgi compartment protein 1 n=1 Tax=Rhynchosporium graminicola TaxID=2792576 RepID=A0A1E1KNP3_9HELO|nr:related to syntaxin family member TLG1 [Rhynchosporium commune]